MPNFEPKPKSSDNYFIMLLFSNYNLFLHHFAIFGSVALVLLNLLAIQNINLGLCGRNCKASKKNEKKQRWSSLDSEESQTEEVNEQKCSRIVDAYKFREQKGFRWSTMSVKIRHHRRWVWGLLLRSGWSNANVQINK